MSGNTSFTGSLNCCHFSTQKIKSPKYSTILMFVNYFVPIVTVLYYSLNYSMEFIFILSMFIL